METTETLKRQVRTAGDLHALVRTMKALAAVNIRQVERAVQSLAEYRRTVELGLQVLVARGGFATATARSAQADALGVVVFGTDQGMCGPLNDQAVAYARASWANEPAALDHLAILAVGTRTAARLQDAGQTLEASLPAASSVNGIVALVQDLLMHIERWHSDRHIQRVRVIFGEHTSRAAYRMRQLDLLPMDRRWLHALQQRPWPTQILPAFTMRPEPLFSALVRQYLFVSLYYASAESLASENASRLAAMRGAERSISERIEELTGRFHRTRQMAITEELLDIAAGFEALGDEQ